MLSTHDGSPDGVTVVRYVEGTVVEVPEPLAAVFVREGWAVSAAETAEPAEPPATTDEPAARASRRRR